MENTVTATRESRSGPRETFNLSLSDLIQAECAAAESYRQVLEMRADVAGYPVLKEMCDEHVRVAEFLMDVAYAEGTDSPRKSGLWGVWSEVASGKACAMSVVNLLRMLRAGEEYNLRLYQQSLHAGFNPKIQFAIRSRILDQQKQHLRDVSNILVALTARKQSYDSLSSIYGYRVGI